MIPHQSQARTIGDNQHGVYRALICTLLHLFVPSEDVISSSHGTYEQSQNSRVQGSLVTKSTFPAAPWGDLRRSGKLPLDRQIFASLEQNMLVIIGPVHFSILSTCYCVCLSSMAQEPSMRNTSSAPDFTETGDCKCRDPYCTYTLKSTMGFPVDSTQAQSVR